MSENSGMDYISKIPSTTAKALRINLDSKIYGTFAEIGAGQETARQFFRVGGASGTIAKAMSAYDKNFSDSVYGTESDGRYVTELRLNRMLEHEIGLLEQRIKRFQNPDKLFFTYANTVATIDFAKRYKGHGWVGLRFQLDPNEPYNEITLHIRFKQNEARLQQETLGIMGVNLIYSAFFKYDNPKEIVEYLYDNLDRDTIEVDTINFSGPQFKDVDNRLMSLQLVKQGMTNAVIFNPQRKNVLPAALLHKKNILTLRGSFRPVTKVNMSMYKQSLEMFSNDRKVDRNNIEVLFEVTLSNLLSDGQLDEQDFIDRADLLCSLGLTVMISRFKEYYRLVEYFSEYTQKRMALSLGVNNLVQIFNEEHYRQLSGGILEAFGKLFHKDLKIYLYPIKSEEKIINSKNLQVHPRLKELYKFFVTNRRILDIENYSEEELDILSREVLKMIANSESGWEEKLPKGVAETIKKKHLFGYRVDENLN